MSSDCFGGFLDQIMTEKKVQSSGHRLQCLGGSMSLDFFGGLLLCFLACSSIKLQITTKRKKSTVVIVVLKTSWCNIS
jgi:hypothetical protein